MIYPDLLDRSALLELERSLLQCIAKREHIKANQKSTHIVHQLLVKYPTGYPASRFTIKKPQIKYEPSVSNSSTSESSPDADKPSRKSKKRRIDAGPRRDRYVQSRLLTAPPRTPSVSPPREAAWAEMVANAGAGSPDASSKISQPPHPAMPPPPPNLKDARFVRREITRHVNDIAHMRADVGEINDLLEHAVSVHRNTMAEYREMSVLRRELEINIVQRMKKERDLWDGTGNMPEEHRGPWERLVKQTEEYKVERKKEARRKEYEEWRAKEGVNRENEARQARLAAQATGATNDTPKAEGSIGSKRKRSVTVDEEE